MVAGCPLSHLAFGLLTAPVESIQQAAANRRPGNQYRIVDQLSFGLAAVLAIEAFNPAGGVYELLLAGEERMAM